MEDAEEEESSEDEESLEDEESSEDEELEGADAFFPPPHWQEGGLWE